MARQIDIDALQQAVQEAEKIDKVRSRLRELSTTLERLNALQDELAEILEGKPSRKTTRKTKKTKKAKTKKVGKLAHPKAGSAAEKLCKVLGKTPKSVGQIAKDSGLSEGTVRVYLGQFDCFENVWGKGYVYKPQGGKAQAAPKTAKKKTSKKKAKRKTRKAKKTTKKAPEAATTG